MTREQANREGEEASKFVEWSVYERDRVLGLLRVEFLRHYRMDLPWCCVEGDCPNLGKPVPRTGCNCKRVYERDHVAAVKRELGL